MFTIISHPVGQKNKHFDQKTMFTIISHPVGQKNKHFDQNKWRFKVNSSILFFSCFNSFKKNVKSTNPIN